VVIDPKRRRTGPPAPVLIESVTADDHPIEISDGPIRIPPGRGKLEIQYTACNLQSPEGVSFRYMLEGFDQKWTASNRRSVNYTNLPPGRYRFRVTATGAGDPRQSEVAASIIWEPHFYETGWFYAATALLVGLAGWAALRMY